MFPVFGGSAVTGAGVEALTRGIRELVPAAAGLIDASPSGLVFKIDRGSRDEKIAYVRMFSGGLRTRDQLAFADGRFGKVSGRCL